MHTALDWNSIYLTCFGIGLILSVLFFATGVGHLHIGHFHIGHGHGVGAKAGHMISPFNGFTLVAFLCWFGGSGYLLHRYSGFIVPIVLIFAVLSGLSGGGLVFFFLTKVIMPMERTLEPSDTEMTGVIGKLSGGIPPNGFGEIIFSQNGSRRAVSVKSDDGSTIERGVEVIVMRYERGIAYVRRWDEFEHSIMGGEKTARINDGPAKE